MLQPTSKTFVLEKIAARLSAKSLIAIGLGFVSVLPTNTFALGIRLPDQDAFATARGEAFVATADNPSAVYYNPAGISQLSGVNARVGGYGILIRDRFENGSTSVSTKEKLQGIPQLFVTAELPHTPLTLGLGLYSPYGLALEWRENAPFLTSPTIPKKGQIEYLTINPVLAWKPHKTLSISAGPTLNHAESELRFTPFGAPNNVRFRGRDEDIGFNAGILWQPLKKHSFGVSYRSQTTMDFTGHADTFIPSALPGPVNGEPANASFAFPQNIAFGYSFRPNKKWNLEVNADWTDWSRLNTVTLNQSVLHQSTPLPLNWHSSWFYEFGATRYFKHGWHLSGGYIYSENSVPNSMFNPIIPDSDRQIFSVGVGRKYKHISWDATYQLSYGPERSVDDLTGFNAAAKGNYHFVSHALALSFGYHF